jgi:signal transduction histidine kinase
VITLVLLPLWLQNRKRFNGIGFWIIDYVFQAVAQYLSFIRGSVPDFVSIFISNLLILAGLIFLYSGILRLFNRKLLLPLHILTLIVIISALAGFLYYQNNITARGIIMMLAVSFYTFLCFHFIFFILNKKDRKIARETGIIFLFYTIISLLRIVRMLFFPISTPYLSLSGIDSLLIYTYVILGIFLTYSLVMIINRKLTDQLNEALLENSQQLIRLEDYSGRLEKANAYKNLFLTSVSHELRSPLNSILSYSAFLKEEISDKKNLADIRSITHCAGHALKMINDLLDLSKIEAGKMNLEIKPVAVRTLIQNVTDMIRQQCIDKGIDLKIIVTPETPQEIETDENRLNQILINLLDNACKYTDEGSIAIVSGSADHHLLISIRDTGIGIPRENIQDIFENYTRFTDLKNRVTGSGLGLAITRTLSELLHIRIEVESEEGAGSQFTLYIPVSYTENTIAQTDR